MPESKKDLSTTSFGLVAAYILPGVIVMGVAVRLYPCVQDFFLQDPEHLTLGIALVLIIGVLLNGLRLAILSRWLFREMSYRESDFEGMKDGQFSELQAAIDEVFRLHQFYSALYFLTLLGVIGCAAWLLWNWYHVTSPLWWQRFPWWCRLLAVLGVLFVWRVLGRATLETYEFYHQIALGVLKKPLPAGPTGRKAWIVRLFFSRPPHDYLDIVPHSGKTGDHVVLVSRALRSTDAVPAVSFRGTQPATPVSAPIVARSDGYLTVDVPNGAISGPITANAMTSTKNFHVTLSITGFNPLHGIAGTHVTINGVGLRETTGVSFHGLPAANFNVVSDTEVTADVPPNPHTGPISVTTPRGTVSSAGNFAVP